MQKSVCSTSENINTIMLDIGKISRDFERFFVGFLVVPFRLSPKNVLI